MNRRGRAGTEGRDLSAVRACDYFLCVQRQVGGSVYSGEGGSVNLLFGSFSWW